MYPQSYIYSSNNHNIILNCVNILYCFIIDIRSIIDDDELLKTNAAPLV